jgi:hypothetical protein
MREYQVELWCECPKCGHGWEELFEVELEGDA